MAFIDRTGNLADMKNRIISYIKIRGPTLPIHITKETKTTLLLSSAFLADMVSEKTLKISNLKIGGSPVYFLPGQEHMLENFYNYLPGKEREAFLMLKEKKVLKDDELEPAIRVAIRSLKDFAFPFSVKFQDRQIVFWQYFLTSEEDAKSLISSFLEKIPQPIQEKPIEARVEVKQEKPVEAKIEIKEEKQEKEGKKEEKPIEPIFEKPKPAKKAKFLDEIKAWLSSKNIELIKIEKQDKKEISIIAKSVSEFLIFALDKKRVDKADILKAYKKSLILKLPYTILARDEPSKKTKESLEAYKNLEKIEKL